MAAACSSLGGWVRRAFSSSAAHASFNSKPDGVLTLASAASSPSPSSSTSASPVSRDAAEQHARTNTTRNAEDLVEGGDGAEEAGGVEPTAAQQGQGWAPNRGVKERHFQKKGCEKRANGRPVPESDEPLETPTPDGVVIPHVHQHSASCASPCAPPDTSFRRDLDERGRWRDEELTRGWLDVRRLKRQVEAEVPALGAQKEEAGGRHTQPSESAVAGNARGRFEPRDREPPEPPNSHTEATLAAASNGGEKPDEWNMRVMTFNILADSLTDYKYRFLDQSIVKWASRANVIETEIFRHRPAICCLQELDATHYHKRFRPFFASLGYDGVYKQKTNGRQDGVGTFWLRSRYELVEQHDVEFSQQSKGLVNKPQVGLVLLLRERVGLAETSAGADGRERIPRTKSSEAASCSSPEAVSPPPSEASRSPVSPFPSRLRFEAAGEETPSSVAHVAWGAGLLHAASVSKRRRGGEERGAQRSVDGRDADAGRRHDATSLDQTRVDPRDEEAAAAQHGRMIIVGNTHLLFDSRRGDIKLAQLLLLLQAVYALRQRALAMIAANLRQQIMRGRETHSPASLDSENERKRRFESYKRTDAPSPARDREGARSTASPLSRSTSPPSLAGAESGEVAEGGGAEKAAERLLDMLLCGDFNFTPQSPLYQLVLQGSFDFSGLDHRKLSGQFLMERHTYRMDAQGYQGRGATIVSTPSESQRITCLDAQQFVRAHMRAAAPLPHSHSEPSRMAETAACLCHGAKPHLAASLAADAAALPPSSSRGSLKLARQTSAPLPQWLQELHRVLGNASLRGGLSPSDLSRSTSLPSATGNPRDTSLRDLRTQPSCAASVITLPLKFNSAYALPKLQRPPKGGATQASHVVMEEPAFTAYHGWQKGCIDYIFYHSEALEVARIYQLPVLAQAKSHGCCPNKVRPDSVVVDD
ncbi:endonuclease/exonuclease/phosphatase family protein [Besnoitia besnoiti]|uniref:Endonuclease/exonuclease/phosphatase family protein n=1 Tax=Besnoitia besnoiti TaxID=94643 RepID=A0A2A9MGY7_BESBE|nr:endonuclease/exonuclease/phosphatase family protein [Besnoitia besnoiti]PFH35531.1 endonuclease/exonuclease/phosphatase family protein [Besnoitia besnoiti]